jgi:hypothetical protein
MKLPYFKIKEAFDEVRDSFSHGSGSAKLTSAAKLLGKSAANIGMLAVEAGANAIKNLPETAGNMAQESLDKHSNSMSEEQIENANKLVAWRDEKRRKEEERKEEERKERTENDSSASP